MFKHWKIYCQLKKFGLLGINQRNTDYIARYNPRRQFPIVDDKLLTKQRAIAQQIPVTPLYEVIETMHEIRKLASILERHKQMAIKPARGSGGEGIIIITGRQQGLYQTAGNRLLSLEQISAHVSDILSGMYSLGNREDKAMFEYKVNFASWCPELCSQGVPDIRIIVFKGYPVMAMLRLPTQKSNGKANLHQGGIGVGIDMATGLTCHGVWQNKSIEQHPDTGHSVIGMAIPHWDKILRLSAECYEVSGLGYVGVDIVLDKNLGPLMLELNARPGLSIQIANNCGLLPRLRLIENLADASVVTVQERLLLVQREFATLPLLDNQLIAA